MPTLEATSYSCTAGHRTVIYMEDEHATPSAIRCPHHYGGSTHYPGCEKQHTCEKEARRLDSTWI